MVSICIVLLFIVLSNALEIEPNDCSVRYCYDLDFVKSNRFHFTTKTPYPRYTDFDVNQEFRIPKCEPQKIWMLVRHGARLPTKKELKDFVGLMDFHEQVLRNYKNRTVANRCRLCNADWEIFKNWKYKKNITKIIANNLMPEGFTDMIMLGKNFRKRFPSLFEQNYTKERYLFGFATEHRTRFSYFGFVEGLFGKGAFRHIPVPRTYVDENDSLLQPYTQCLESIKNAKSVDGYKQQGAKFLQTPPLVQVIREVSHRLGFNEPLKSIWLRIIWEWCKYESGWHPLDPSPWCVAFLPHHYPYLEYYDDIRFYYKKSYGSPGTRKLACAAINNMLYYLDSDDSYKVIAYFVHSTLMQLFHTALGLFKDSESLRADNYESMIKNRAFNSSNNLPLSGNIAVVKYKCSMKGDPYKVMFFLNQRPMNLSWCYDGLCELSDVRDMYAHYAKMNCSESFCDPHFEGFDAASTAILDFKWLLFLFFILICFIIYFIKSHNTTQRVRFKRSNTKMAKL